jgi:zinc transport system substrate-binding protein
MNVVLSIMIVIALAPFFYQSLSGQIENSSANSESGIFLTNSTAGTSFSNQSITGSEKLKVLSSFYPIHEFVKKVGGDNIYSSILIPPETEPHDFEPTINQIQVANSADVLVYSGLGIEKWIERIDTPHKIDSSKDLSFLYTDNRNKTIDPHVWLDPLLAKMQVENIRDGLTTIDPSNRDNYFNNARNYLNELDTLDNKIRTDLQSCEKRDFVAFHKAFSYFAERYGLKQHSITTGGPEEEIKPQRLAQIIETARNLDLHVIYSEELMDPRSASAIAQEIPNGRVLVLSPIEGITQSEQDSGIGYIDKMEQNIQNLKVGLQCGE